MNRKDEIIKECLEIKEQIEALTQKDKALREEMKIYLNNENLKEYVDGSENKVTFTTVVQLRLDKNLVEQKMAPEDFEQCFKEVSFETLKIVSKESAEKIKAMWKKK